MYIVVAEYRLKPEHIDTALELLREMARETAGEAGCRAYVINQSVEDPAHILFYEQYVDEAAFQEHANSPHFERIITAQVWALIESRQREIYSHVAG